MVKLPKRGIFSCGNFFCKKRNEYGDFFGLGYDFVSNEIFEIPDQCKRVDCDVCLHDMAKYIKNNINNSLKADIIASHVR